MRDFATKEGRARVVCTHDDLAGDGSTLRHGISKGGHHAPQLPRPYISLVYKLPGDTAFSATRVYDEWTMETCEECVWRLQQKDCLTTTSKDALARIFVHTFGELSEERRRGFVVRLRA